MSEVVEVVLYKKIYIFEFKLKLILLVFYKNYVHIKFRSNQPKFIADILSKRINGSEPITDQRIKFSLRIRLVTTYLDQNLVHRKL